MQTITRKLGLPALLFAAGMAVGGATTGVTLAFERQPHMYAARRALFVARNQLEAAQHNKGGHRAAALNLVLQAIQQVDQGIRYADTH